MALNGFLDIELSVKNPAELGAFWERHGLRRTADGVYGTDQRSTVITIKEGDHRHLSAMHFSTSHDSDIADMKNVGPRDGGSITAAQFIGRFIKPGVKWAHLDVAGTVWAAKPGAVHDKGATGYGVRLLDRFVADNFEG